ncbi:MAG: glycoside hydrolase family 3 N-terminal domain-containing protein, partial [Phycisphaerae bacterium]
MTLQSGGEAEATNPGIRKQKIEELLGLIRSGRVGAFLGAHGAGYTNRLQKAAVEESRHGIPLLFGNDVIHGYRTLFPIPLGEAASWDPSRVERACRVAATEARASGTHWTFAPMIDICRDPRWGRVAEGAGEDPYLGSVMAAARVRGFQGDDPADRDSVLACAKHFVAYGAAEGGRDYNTVDLSEQTLREIHLPPFKAAKDAGVASYMSASNEINGISATANHLTLRRILRKEWGFDGFVVSDWTSITEMIIHGFSADAKDAAEQAILAGVDMDMSSSSYRTHLGESVRKGRLSERSIDRAVRRVLRAKLSLGLWDRPYSDPEREKTVILSEEHRAMARDMARHAVVLLKNDNHLLPLSETIRSLALIGPLADNQKDSLGIWVAVGRPEDVVTVAEGVRRRVGQATTIRYARGCDVRGGTMDGFEEAIEAARASDAAILVVGESEDMSGEAYCRTTLELPPLQQELVEAVHAIGKPTVVVLMNGRPLSIGWIAKHVPAVLETWQLGVECGNAIADVLFGDFNPGGKLPITFPRTVGQIPIYHSHKNTGRPPGPDRHKSKYIDIPSTPLFPFGFGLSYTEFKFDNLTVEPGRIGPRGQVRITVEVKIIGDREDDEVARLYIRDLVGSMTRPVKQLKGFRRIHLKPGERKTLIFMLTHEHL